ncbi:hypothetical protein KIH74_04000 [Kineosporia sp. J2-2]|uniref:DUF2231 domain-containing protein n=1 Tax=Kineosporia corallincola TaxID=2835133 RepID=A0ABS5TAI3_9ACTN|nr:DUF2231 domain-containing protein [Kineosporia corallincola]MBT0768070.1 hypothetical protein [Kineosporia corallincola]
MFDLVNGMPVHALVVHAVVILLPLMSVVTVAFVLRPRWRRELPWAVLGNLLAAAATYAAMESGEKLQARLSNPDFEPVAKEHGDIAQYLIWFAIAQFVVSLIVWLLLRTRDESPRTSAPKLATSVVLTLAVGIAAVAWTYRVGDSGAAAVWKDSIASTNQ